MSTTKATALFIPLSTCWYEAFRSGSKWTELRPYGPRWNEATCFIGRAAVLSKGYGRWARLPAVVRAFACHPFSRLDKPDRLAFESVYGPQAPGALVACITLAVTGEEYGLHIQRTE